MTGEKVSAVAVIGATRLGAEIAYRAAAAGYKTILEDVSDSRLEAAIRVIREKFDAKASGAEPDTKSSEAALANLSTASAVEDAIRDADLVIETTADEMELKIELFTIFDKFGKPNAIFLSTSPSLSISEMAEVTFCAERCIGMRFGDSEGAERIELVRGRETSEETVRVCEEVGRKLGGEVAIVRESGDGASSSVERRAAGAHD